MYVLPLEVDCFIDSATEVGDWVQCPPLEELNDGNGARCLSISLPCGDDFSKGIRAATGFGLLIFPSNDRR